MAKKHSQATELMYYMITGGAWFWSGYIMFAVLYGVLHLDIVPAKVASYIFGLSVNFILERFWVFSSKTNTRQLEGVTLRYVLLSVLNLGIDTGIVWGLNRVGITPYVGQFVSAAFFTVWNYIWYKFWVFTKGAPGPKRPAAPTLRRPKHVRPKRK